MLNFNSILIFSENPKKLADFYQKVFGKELDMEGDGYYGLSVGKGFITIGPHGKVKGISKNPERIMLNFETEDVEKEFERIKRLGAKVIAKPYSMGNKDTDEMMIATFADLDGNYFQLVTPWDETDENYMEQLN